MAEHAMHDGWYLVQALQAACSMTAVDARTIAVVAATLLVCLEFTAVTHPGGK
jgi:hypothetical protein